jgi:hypothetical protein
MSFGVQRLARALEATQKRKNIIGTRVSGSSLFAPVGSFPNSPIRTLHGKILSREQKTKEDFTMPLDAGHIDLYHVYEFVNPPC